MKIRYFAWVRERIGKAEETLLPPAEVATIADLLGWLKTLGPEYEWALEKAEFIRVALDHVHADHAAAIAGADEIALFPPMTGG
ncbi:MAG: molybdopterin converting factor subunit 1 [Hyphomicrobiales bacterium]|nr:molybdopterin converting factor subunit 1 [Hyphomicrobiales bacterium]